MGNKHQLSLRLKTKQNWGNTSYYFNSKNEQYSYWGLDKIALNVIKHYFQFALISKPKFYHNTNKVIIKFFYFLNNNSTKNNLQPTGIQSSLQNEEAKPRALEASPLGYYKLIPKLSKLYGKSVELRPVRIHYPYLNSYILAQYVAFNIKSGNLNNISRNLFKKAKLIKSNRISKQLNLRSNNINNTPLLWKNFIKYSSEILNPQYLTGIKLQISGRLSSRKSASRTRVVRKSIGTLRLSSCDSNIDASQFHFKTKNGAATVKIWLSSAPILNSHASHINFILL